MSMQEPVGRIRFMDRQRVNLDGFAVENPELGLTALRSPHDPKPSLVVTGGRVTELDGVPETDFDSIDTFIASSFILATCLSSASGTEWTVFSRVAWFFTMYSAESAWLAKLMSITDAGCPSAAARLMSRPSPST